MPSFFRPSSSVIAVFLTPLAVACSSSDGFETGRSGTGTGSSSGNDAATAGSGGTHGATGGSSSGAASGTGGRLGATGGSAGSSQGGSGGSNVGGSGGRTANDAGACAFSTAPPAPPNVDSSAPQQEQANAAGLRTLDFLIGRFLRGEVTVYQGTATAHDNWSALVNSIVSGPRPDGVIPQGPALALLQVRPATERDWDPWNPNATGTTATLVVHGLPPDQHVIFRQHSVEPGITEVGLLSGVATTVNMVASCSGCVPDLAGKPATIAFSDATATGPTRVFIGYAGDGGHYEDLTAKVTASVDLETLPPCALTFEDLAVLNSATGPNEVGLTLRAFKQSGNEMVYATGGSFTVGGTPMCPLVQSYTMELYVDLDDLGHYGTRNFVAGTPSVQCVPGAP